MDFIQVAITYTALAITLLVPWVISVERRLSRLNGERIDGYAKRLHAVEINCARTHGRE